MHTCCSETSDNGLVLGHSYTRKCICWVHGICTKHTITCVYFELSETELANQVHYLIYNLQWILVQQSANSEKLAMQVSIGEGRGTLPVWNQAVSFAMN